MLLLLLFSQGLLLAAGQKKSRGTKSLCTLPSHNVSLAALGENDFYSAENRADNTVIYLSLCHPLRNLTDSVAKLCDPMAFACIIKLNTTTGEETEYQRNAGLGSGPPQISTDGGHLQLIFENGGDCQENLQKTPGHFATWIDFFCSSDPEMHNSIRYEGKFGNCASQVFWHTSLACLPGSGEEALPQKGTCLLRIPGYGTSLDLSSWSQPGGFRSVADPEGNSSFVLNLCSPVTGGLCTNETVACEVDQQGLVSNLINKSHKRTLKYNEFTEVITLKYEDQRSRVVEIDIKCDKSSTSPTVKLMSKSAMKHSFEMLTTMACLVPPVQCTAEDKDGDVFSLAMLGGIEWEIGVEDTTQKYAIKVCGSLPMNSDNPCKGQAGVCTYSEGGVEGKKTNPINLGLMSQKPQINDDHSISMMYEKGDTYTDPVTNETCKRSAEITLICDDQEKGPRAQKLADPCRHSLVWETPAACPQKKAVSHNCTVREPRWSNLFNLTSLHNKTHDHRINGSNFVFVFNVCGSLLSKCDKANEICFEHEKDLSYDDGSLVMHHTSLKACPTNPKINMTASINFQCEHGIVNSPPRATLVEEACQVEVEWWTSLACPPHQEVQCSLTTKDGLVDLFPLSQPRGNYEIQADGGGQFTINVCRSLVHTSASHCPYASAACFTKIVNGSTDSNNLGQLGRRGPYLGPDGRVMLSYKLGSVCLHPNSNRNHIETVIYFDCAENVTDSEPEFLEQNLCQYSFQWSHAAACPVKQNMAGNCKVTNPASGFTFDMSSLWTQGSDYHRQGAYHHFHFNVDFNVCGALTSDSTCSPGAGICSSEGKNMGQANANLTVDDGQLSLTYRDGDACQDSNGGQSKMETRINFICPPRRSLASGNHEGDSPVLVQRNTRCQTTIEFYTDLACDYQVHCQVSTENAVYDLTRLRHHQKNYHVKNTESGQPDFVLNVCGPLVPADVPMSKCNPHGACGQIEGRYQGLGRVQQSPTMGENGHLVIEYTEGGVCGNRGQQWRTQIIFTCEKHNKLSAEHPLGRPEHVSTEDCLTTFKFPTVLACNDTTADQIIEPDSCSVFHPGSQTYVDIHQLIGKHPYKIEDATFKGDRYFEIQPCGRVASCSGAICMLHVQSNSSKSLGSLSDFMYEPTLDSVRLRYTNGDICNSQTMKQWASKIYYTCDRNAGIGAPVIRETYDCLVIFDWRTTAFCPEQETTLPPIPDVVPEHEATAGPEEPRVQGGTGWGMTILSLLLIATLISGVVLYKKPEARERVIRVLQETRARMPVVLGGRGRDDSTLLVSNGRFGSLADDDDFS